MVVKKQIILSTKAYKKLSDMKKLFITKLGEEFTFEETIVNLIEMVEEEQKTGKVVYIT